MTTGDKLTASLLIAAFIIQMESVWKLLLTTLQDCAMMRGGRTTDHQRTTNAGGAGLDRPDR